MHGEEGGGIGTCGHAWAEWWGLMHDCGVCESHTSTKGQLPTKESAAVMF